MPDDNNTANQNQNSPNLDAQQKSDDPGAPQPPNSDEQQIQNLVNEVAGKNPQTQQQPQEQSQANTPKPVVEETSAPPPPAPPSMDSGEDLSSPPPPPPPGGNEKEDGVSDQKETLPPPPPPAGGQGSSGNQPPGGIPPVVASPKAKKKRFGGKKMVATVLGILFLIGGVGAGVLLVQNNQDIRERAAVVQDGGGGGGSSCTPAGSCISSSNAVGCCSGSSPKFDSSCPLNSRCQTDSGGGGGGEEDNDGGGGGGGGSTSKLPNGSQCTSASQCESNRCEEISGVPGGKYCLQSSSSQGGGEGTACGSSSDCRSGLTCRYISGYPKCTSSNDGYSVDSEPECQINSDCAAGEFCTDSGTCEVLSGGGTNYQCTSRGSTGVTSNLSSSINITTNDINSCNNSCGSQNVCEVWITRFKCDSNSTQGGCQENSNVLRKVNAKTASGQCISGGFDQSTECGTQQIDIGCFGSSNSYGTYAFLSYVGPTSCSGGGGNGGSTLSARCLNIMAYDTEGNQLTSEDLNNLQPGDTVRFAVSGSTSNGSIDRARFTINGTQGQAVTQKIPNTELFYDEYTIPEDISSFSIRAELHHTNASIGWF